MQNRILYSKSKIIMLEMKLRKLKKILSKVNKYPKSAPKKKYPFLEMKN